MMVLIMGYPQNPFLEGSSTGIVLSQFVKGRNDLIGLCWLVILYFCSNFPVHRLLSLSDFIDVT